MFVIFSSMAWLFFQYGTLPLALIDACGGVFVVVSLADTLAKVFAYKFHTFWYHPDVFHQTANRWVCVPLCSSVCTSASTCSLCTCYVRKGRLVAHTISAVKLDVFWTPQV